MILKIKNPNTSEIFVAEINISEKNDETKYQIIFSDKRL
jgi:hypothetical protein